MVCGFLLPEGSLECLPLGGPLAFYFCQRYCAQSSIMFCRNAFLYTFQHLLQSQMRVAVGRGREIQFFLCFVGL